MTKREQIKNEFDPQSFDARIWAKEFMRCKSGTPPQDISKQCVYVDEEDMRGWFANAIMAGYDEAKRIPKKLYPDWGISIKKSGGRLKNEHFYALEERIKTDEKKINEILDYLAFKGDRL